MFKKGLVITNAFTLWKETGAMVGRFSDEFKPYGVKIDHLTNSSLVAYVGSNGEVKTNINGYDFIIYLDKDYYVSSLLEKAGYHLFNSSAAVHICDDKMLTHVVLSNNGIRMPKTISYPLRFGPGNDKEFLDKVIKELGFPMIVKNCFGSLGEQVHLIKDTENFYGICKTLEDVPHIFQEFIGSSFGTDLRVALVGGKAIANMKREAQTKDEFRSNIETGGIGHMIPFPPEFKEMAEKVSKIIGLDYCGLDLLFGPNGKPILCEVNSNAYFGPIEKYSGVNVASYYAKHIYSTIYKK